MTQKQMDNTSELKEMMKTFMTNLLDTQPVNALEYMISWSESKLREEEQQKRNVINKKENLNAYKYLKQNEEMETEHEQVIIKEIEQVLENFNELAHDYIDHFKALSDGARDRYMLELEDSFYGIEELRVLEDDMHMHRAKLNEVIDLVNKAKERLEALQQEDLPNIKKVNLLKAFYAAEKTKFNQLGDIHQHHIN